MPTRFRLVLLLAALALPTFGTAAPAADAALAVEPDRGPFDGLEYRSIGPAAGGRVSRVAGVAGDPRTAWAATAAGGVWKSVDGGDTWKPVFDDQPVSSIGSIAVAPSDPNVVYVGSGEANIRGNVGEGNGIYVTTDGGETWRHAWESEGQIGTMIVDPRDPDVAFAAVLGSPFGPGRGRGVYRTTDGGATWSRVLFVDEDTGASDVCFVPGNPRILFAGTWQTRRTPWSLTSGGPGSGLWTSRDGGETWTRLAGEGLPDGIWGKVGVRVARTDPDRVYALIEAEEGGLFRSDDGGETWARIQASRGLRQRAWYYSTLTIDPTNADVVWFPQVGMLRTVDGGRTVARVEAGGWDYHDVWIDPENPDRILVASDAGVSLSRDGGTSFRRPPIPIAQFYHLSVDTNVPYRVLGSLQDRGTVSGPSRTLHGGGILLSDWHPVGGGEAGHVVANPDDPDVVWAGEYLGFVSRWEGATRRAPHVGIDPDNGSGHGAVDARYRFQWTAPIAISPHDPEVVYHAGNVLFRTDDGGQTWTPISPDLTRDDEGKQQWSGGPLTGDNTGVEYYGTIFAVAESPVSAGVIWAGTDDGRVHVTRDGGGTWTDVSPKDLPEWATVGCIEPSRQDAATAWIVADRHRLDDESPYLWSTTDFGRTWKRLGRDLDPEVYLKVVRQDPVAPDVLYLGTERGVLVSRDRGRTWGSLRLDLPTVAVVDLAVTDRDLVVGTLGRSAYILDDLTPVRTTSPEIEKAPAHLFPPTPTIAWYVPSSWSAPLGSSEGAGDNPPRGVLLTVHLTEVPEEPVTIEILDAERRVVRTLSSEARTPYTPVGHPDRDPEAKDEPDLEAEVGFLRTAWDLRYERARWVEGSRIDTGGPIAGPVALPGRYTARLRAGETVVEQPIVIEPDPRSDVAAEDREAQFAFLLGLRDRANRIVDLVETIASLREQITERATRLGDAPGALGLVAEGEAIVETLDRIERILHNPDAEVAYDILAGRGGGAQLYSRYGWLAGGADAHVGPPTQGMLEVAAELDGILDARAAALERLIDEDVAELNRRAAEAGIAHVVVPRR